MSPRQLLANRRAAETFGIDHEGQRYKVSLGRELLAVGNLVDMKTSRRTGELGPVVEVFVTAQKPNSEADALAGDGAILMSLLLQHGCGIETIHHAMKRNPDGSPSSPLGRAAALIAESTSQGE